VSVQAPDTTAGRVWYVTVEPETSLLPAAVKSLVLADGPAPGDVVATWVSVAATAYPVADYLVACSYAGPVDADNWDAALLLGTYPHQPGAAVHYSRTYGVADGMVPGETIWFAVRARDDHGQLSPVVGVYARNITYPWNLHVEVRADTGAPLQGVILDYVGGKAYTDEAGRASIGPQRNIDAVTLRTTSTLFDFTPPVQTVTADTLKIVLIGKYVLDSVPCDQVPYPDFLAYLRGATQTELATTGTVLHKWERYPLSVYVYPGLSPTKGWDMHGLILDALPIWNDALAALVPGDGAYLVETPDSTAADIIITPTDMPSHYNGYTTVIDPGGDIGEFVPRRMRITIEKDLDTLGEPNVVALPERYTEVAIHELGHALGHYGHTCSNSGGNLMDAGGAIGSLADGPANAINLDERRTVIAVRHLPEAVDMARYEMPVSSLLK